MLAHRRPNFQPEVSGSVWSRTRDLQEVWSAAIQQEVAKLEQYVRKESLQSCQLLKGLLARNEDQGWLTGKQQRLRKVLQYVACRNGLGATAQTSEGAAELSAAMHSTFSMAALPTFERMSASARAQHLEHIAQVVLGVCVYNQSQNVFATAASLPTALSIQSGLQQLAIECRSWHSAIRCELIGLRRKVSTRAVVGAPPDDQMQRLAACIALHTLALDCTAQLLTALQACLDGLDASAVSRRCLLAALQDTVQDGAAAIPRDKIFPIFKELAESHQQTVAWLQKAECLPRLWELLRTHVGQALPEVQLLVAAAAAVIATPPVLPPSFPPHSMSAAMPGPSEAGQEADSSEDEAAHDASTTNRQSFSSIQTTASAAAIPSLQPGAAMLPNPDQAGGSQAQGDVCSFGGHCPVLLADGAGLLWPAQSSLQPLQHSSRSFAFSSQAAFTRFQAQPDACIAALQVTMNQLPALSALLTQLESSSAAASTSHSASIYTLQRLTALPTQQAKLSHLSVSRVGTSASMLVSTLLPQDQSGLTGLDNGLSSPSLMASGAGGVSSTVKQDWSQNLPGKLSMHSAPLSHSQSSGDRPIKALRPRPDPQQQGISPPRSSLSSPHGKPPLHPYPAGLIPQEQRIPTSPGSPKLLAMSDATSTRPLQSPTCPASLGVSSRRGDVSPTRTARAASASGAQELRSSSGRLRGAASIQAMQGSLTSPVGAVPQRIQSGWGSSGSSQSPGLLTRDASAAWLAVEEHRENVPWPFALGFGGAPMLRQHSARSTQRASAQANSLLSSTSDTRRTAESKRQTTSARQAPAGSQHVAIQTDLHSPAAAFDPAYEWNLWSVRRRAVALTNLRHKATHSAQTESSCFRRHTATQYWQPKGSTTQTPTERGQSMPKKMQQIRGFPHSKDSCAVVTTINIDIGQPYEL
ncbi:hypothetical protein WJX74_009125 [Apatococcus lobatus]|uniref:Cilia- and flagella-associated protein 206 n=1 Tax=Apatococcus lobatus TaxID=904363 RepID=A0AAW1R0G5_9CHLO